MTPHWVRQALREHDETTRPRKWIANVVWFGTLIGVFLLCGAFFISIHFVNEFTSGISFFVALFVSWRAGKWLGYADL